jgi:hypothetical protein
LRQIPCRKARAVFSEGSELEQFLFEESCRLEQASALMGRARGFLKGVRIEQVQPNIRNDGAH